MKKSIFFILLLIISVLSISSSGCSSWVRDLTDLVHSAPNVIDTITQRAGGGLVRGLRDTLTNDDSKKIAALIDVIMSKLDSNAKATGTSLKDSLLSESTKNWILDLKNELLGSKTDAQIAQLMDELIGNKTKSKIESIINSITGENTARNLEKITRESITDPISSTFEGILNKLEKETAPSIRDSLLNSKATSVIDSLISRSLNRFDRTLDSTFIKAHREEGTLTKYAKEIIWSLIAGLALLTTLIGWLSYAIRKKSRVMDIITSQIHDIPNQNSYDELTKRIKSLTMQNGLEGYFKNYLLDKGLITDKSIIENSDKIKKK